MYGKLPNKKDLLDKKLKVCSIWNQDEKLSLTRNRDKSASTSTAETTPSQKLARPTMVV